MMSSCNNCQQYLYSINCGTPNNYKYWVLLQGNNMYPKHRIYGIYVEDELFYIGYSDRDLDQRLKEHAYSSLNPTTDQLLNDVITGEENGKRKIIRTATEEGFELTIKCLKESYTYEPLDEEAFIQHYKQEGYILTNIATGGVFQKHSLIDGELVDVAKMTSAEAKQHVQDFKYRQKNKPKKVKTVPKPEPRTLTDDEKREYLTKELGEEQANYLMSMKRGTMTEWQKGL